MEQTSPVPPNYVGLDISKERLDYTLDGVAVPQLPNNPTGHARLVRLLRRVPAVRVVCEASGGYERELVACLLTSGLEVCVVQPGRVRAFAHAEGLLAKTDQLDAKLLRRYGEKIQPRLAVPVDPAAAALRELLEHRRQLSDQLVATRNRLEQAGPTLRPLLQRQESFLAKELQQVEALIKAQIDDDDDLHRKAKRLQELEGVGPILAATLLGYVPELGEISSSELAALIGVAPFARDSGELHRPRCIRGGRAAVRHVLYMAAVSATRCNPIFSALYRRMREAGKPAKVCLVAIMRRMLSVLNRLLAEPQFNLAH